MRPKAGDRIVVHLHAQASVRQQREVGAFVRYCVFRMERELGEQHWLISITPTREGFTCSVVVTIENLLVESRGRGFDGVSAAWDALTNAEQALRESRSAGQHREIDHLVASDVGT